MTKSDGADVMSGGKLIHSTGWQSWHQRSEMPVCQP